MKLRQFSIWVQPGLPNTPFTNYKKELHLASKLQANETQLKLDNKYISVARNYELKFAHAKFAYSKLKYAKEWIVKKGQNGKGNWRKK